MDNPVVPYLPELVAGAGAILVLLAIVGLIVLFARRLRRIEDKIDALGLERSGTPEAPDTSQRGTGS
jgi:hypothetical protein